MPSGQEHFNIPEAGIRETTMPGQGYRSWTDDNWNRPAAKPARPSGAYGYGTVRQPAPRGQQAGSRGTTGGAG